jgi:hypothetical protein
MGDACALILRAARLSGRTSSTYTDLKASMQGSTDGSADSSKWMRASESSSGASSTSSKHVAPEAGMSFSAQSLPAASRARTTWEKPPPPRSDSTWNAERSWGVVQGAVEIMPP